MAFAEVGLYWDFENVGIGAGFSMADLAALLTRVRGYGRLHESRLYYDSCKASSEGFLSKHRELVERLGVTLVDCPTSDKKEAIDKKIIVDCLVWALGRSSRLQSACVVLMSSDGDFAHMLSRLEQHGVRTIVIGRSAVLRTVCHTALTLREACSGADTKGGGEEGGGTEGGVAGDASGSGDHAPAAVPAASGTKRKRCGGSGAAAAAAASDAAAGSEAENARRAVVCFGAPILLRFVACDRFLGTEAGGAHVTAGGAPGRRPEHLLCFERSGAEAARGARGAPVCLGMHVSVLARVFTGKGNRERSVRNGNALSASPPSTHGARARDAPRTTKTTPLSGPRREAPRRDASIAAAAHGRCFWCGVCGGTGPLVRSQWRLAVHASRGHSRSGAWDAVACGRSRLSVLPERRRRLFARRPLDRRARVAACRRAVGRSGPVAGGGSGGWRWKCIGKTAEGETDLPQVFSSQAKFSFTPRGFVAS